MAPDTRGKLTAPDESIRALYARLDDLSDAASRGEPAATAFLTPREAKYARSYLAHRLSAGLAVLWGGYAGAERVRAFLLPDWLEGLVDPQALADDPADALEAAGFPDAAAFVRDCVIALRVKGSGFRTLSHRDYLGSVMGAGLERDALGDVLVEDDSTAVLLCGRRVADYLLTDLHKVGADTVRVSALADGETPCAVRRVQPLSDTVASQRLDCIVASLCNLSRDKAQTAIRSGLCELDYECTEDCDTEVEPPAVLSVRGCGKFRVLSFDGETRKGRLRLRAEKYI